MLFAKLVVAILVLASDLAACVDVTALPVILIFHVPDAPPPVVDGAPRVLCEIVLAADPL
jgi:hypothetical protein